MSNIAGKGGGHLPMKQALQELEEAMHGQAAVGPNEEEIYKRINAVKAKMSAVGGSPQGQPTGQMPVSAGTPHQTPPSKVIGPSSSQVPVRSSLEATSKPPGPPSQSM